jgi:hypothetical protein
MNARCTVILASAALLCTGALRAADWGELEGKFVYEGTRPLPTKIDVSKDVECCGSSNLVDESLLVDEHGGIANILIYVSTKDVKVHPEAASEIDNTVLLQAKSCRYDPRILPFWYPHQALTTTNSDNCAHSPNLCVPAGLTQLSPNLLAPVLNNVRFRRESSYPFPVVCNIHPWMKAYVMPRNTPYFAVSAADGTIKIANLPVGELELRVWHERTGFLDAPGWTRGRFKFDVKTGFNKLGDDGVVKLSADLFTAPAAAAGASGGE